MNPLLTHDTPFDDRCRRRPEALALLHFG